MHATFAVMDFANAVDPERVHIENMAGALYLDGQGSVFSAA
ncbi:MAG TPA: hypothetical protein VFZ32_07890 [Micromonosporaceae bacterium]